MSRLGFDLTWLGHATFHLKGSPDGPSILIDPTNPAGTLPSEVETDPDPFALIWADAKVPDLKAAYKAKNELYEMNRDGHVADKSQMLTGEDLERLKREVAWLKEKAFGGG